METKKEKVICFFCDIMGTLIGSNKANDADYELFTKLLLKLKEEQGVQKIIFSLISSDNFEFVLDEENTLSSFFGNLITLGEQFFDKGFIDIDGCVEIKKNKGKVFTIYNYCNELSNKYDIQKIYYADDCEMYHDMLKTILNETKFNNKIISFIPSNNIGIAELNQLLNRELSEPFEIENSKLKI